MPRNTQHPSGYRSGFAISKRFRCLPACTAALLKIPRQVIDDLRMRVAAGIMSETEPIARALFSWNITSAVIAMQSENQTVLIEGWIQRLKTGDDQARKELINCACDRLTRLSRKMLRGFHRVKRWEATDDVAQNALMRLYRTLAEVKPATAIEFYRLAATNIRRELLDLARHYYGPQGLGANYATVEGDTHQTVPGLGHAPSATGEDAGRLEMWANFHEQVEHLPDEDKEVFDLLWYQQLPQAEVAQLLDVSERTVKRRWASARLKLHEALGGQSPES
jgi:RNA polymerase sigma factor (sigma-70 family)